jgi:hypothetical protein
VRIRYVSPAPWNIASTVAGTGSSALTGDGGLATSAALANPSLGTDDGLGGWLIADSNNRVVRIREGIERLFAGGYIDSVPCLREFNAVDSAPYACNRLADSDPDLDSVLDTDADEFCDADGCTPVAHCPIRRNLREWLLWRWRRVAALSSSAFCRFKPFFFSVVPGPATSALTNAPGIGCPDGVGGFIYVSTHIFCAATSFQVVEGCTLFPFSICSRSKMATSCVKFLPMVLSNHSLVPTVYPATAVKVRFMWARLPPPPCHHRFTTSTHFFCITTQACLGRAPCSASPPPSRRTLVATL